MKGNSYIYYFFCSFCLYSPDTRVIKLIRLLGKEKQPQQKRILCMNKVDLVTDKKDLLKVAKEFGDLPGYDRYVSHYIFPCVHASVQIN
jgi:putative ribosome biogenesis GTPase RsgA